MALANNEAWQRWRDYIRRKNNGDYCDSYYDNPYDPDGWGPYGQIQDSEQIKMLKEKIAYLKTELEKMREEAQYIKENFLAEINSKNITIENQKTYLKLIELALFIATGSDDGVKEAIKKATENLAALAKLES